MSLEKGILHGKEHRAPFHGAKAVDPMCRNHGACSHCEKNRRFNELRTKARIESELKEFYEENEQGRLESDRPCFLFDWCFVHH